MWELEIDTKVWFRLHALQQEIGIVTDRLYDGLYLIYCKDKEKTFVVHPDEIVELFENKVIIK